jgi:hypothetical protein
MEVIKVLPSAPSNLSQPTGCTSVPANRQPCHPIAMAGTAPHIPRNQILYLINGFFETMRRYWCVDGQARSSAFRRRRPGLPPRARALKPRPYSIIQCPYAMDTVSLRNARRWWWPALILHRLPWPAHPLACLPQPLTPPLSPLVAAVAFSGGVTFHGADHLHCGLCRRRQDRAIALRPTCFTYPGSARGRPCSGNWYGPSQTNIPPSSKSGAAVEVTQLGAQVNLNGPGSAVPAWPTFLS